jgi:hypothetical protein
MKIIAGQPRLGNNRVTWWFHMRRHRIREWWRGVWFGNTPPGEQARLRDFWIGSSAMPDSDLQYGAPFGTWTRTCRGWEWNARS